MKKKGFWISTGVTVVAGLLAVAQAAPLYGEQQGQVQLGLAPNVNVPWSSASSTLFTCTNATGCVVLHVVPRSASGTQPLTFTMTVGGNTSAAFTTTSVTILNQFTVPMSAAAFITNGQSVTVAPLTTTTGSLTFDVLGYNVS